MPSPSLLDDERVATERQLPVPRGIVFRYSAPGGGNATAADAQAAVGAALNGWPVVDAGGLPGWFKALAPAGPLPLGPFWETLRAVVSIPRVSRVEPLFLMANPQPQTAVAADAFALGAGREHFGLWGVPYDETTTLAIATARKNARWHLEKLHVADAWVEWRNRRPALPTNSDGDLPGQGIVVGHPDTGYTDHPQVTTRFLNKGRSFIRGEADGADAPPRDARDDLTVSDDWFPNHPEWFLQNPGHGTSTASVIASGEGEGQQAADVFGVAPGARVLPLRVSRSVMHLDFDAVGEAIAYAVAQGAHVISMSLGGPFYSGYLHECIKKAHEAGMIVVSAAGNCVPATVFPAAFPEVIGVAALHAGGAPWRFSGIGRLVDVIAPGEDVTCAQFERDDAAATPKFAINFGTGTSFATACVAGIAALWLSRWGGRGEVAKSLGNRIDLVPFAFQYLLRETADTSPAFLRDGDYGAGIPNAAELLRRDLPSLDDVKQFKRSIDRQRVGPLTFLAGLFTGGRAVTEGAKPAKAHDTTHDAKLLEHLLGDDVDVLRDELLARVAADRLLLVGFQRWRRGDSVLPLLDRLLSPPPAPEGSPADAGEVLSSRLHHRLREQRGFERERLAATQRGRLSPGVPPAPPAGPGRPAAPAFRPLRAYAFDPSLDTKLETAHVTQVVIPARWERLEPGPVGEYLEVVDVDPASGCVYAPVDLNHPHVLAQDGLAPSEGNPQFHQQMVYAVAMNTIHRFELALGRPVFWSPLRPWLKMRPEEERYLTPEALALMERERREEIDRRKKRSATSSTAEDLEWRGREDRYVRRLRVYPHALREPNAYYSPAKRALLFGYFPASDQERAGLPGGLVFTCLSHDIIAHETTHALLDGMHPFFNEPSNPDVWAFHEAFADIMALFQHFTYPEVLRHQIANTRGNLEADNLLAQLAQQFGQATGKRAALRNALGEWKGKTFTRHEPNPALLQSKTDPHGRGSILVAAVFDAFLDLYNDRVADLLRIATGGTGVLPAGSIHPDLVNRLANEAAAVAEEVLRTCIRAMDCVPPVDITFGEFLRALVTADYDLFSGERRKNRIAFIDAFRAWGIYPDNVPTLSEESLRWRPAADDDPLTCLKPDDDFAIKEEPILRDLLDALEAWHPRLDEAATDEPAGARGKVFQRILRAQQGLHALLKRLQERTPKRPLIPGLNLNGSFSLGNLRPARRVGPQGEFRSEMVVEVVQSHRRRGTLREVQPLRGGATLVVDLLTWKVRYVVYKRLYDTSPGQKRRTRLSRRVEAQRMAGDLSLGRGTALDTESVMALDTGDRKRWLEATYACEAAESEQAERRRRRRREEPFALLHGVGELAE